MIIPSIDLLNDKVVRLRQGQFNQVEYFSHDPLFIAKKLQMQQADLIHVVDLDACQNPKNRQLQSLSNLIEQSQTAIQVGGGIRSASDVSTLLQLGVQRVVIGSIAILEPELTLRLFDQYGADRIILALDVKQNDEGQFLVQTAAWQKASTTTLTSALQQYQDVCQYLLCTDISTDGTLAGPNLALYKNITTNYPNYQLIASGGIGSLIDIEDCASAGVDSIIIGKALLTQQFTLEEALSCWQNASSLV